MPLDPADYVTIPRLAEYYRGGRVVGWGDSIPPEFTPKAGKPRNRPQPDRRTAPRRSTQPT
jgi:hypothetical protein